MGSPTPVFALNNSVLHVHYSLKYYIIIVSMSPITKSTLLQSMTCVHRTTPNKETRNTFGIMLIDYYYEQREENKRLE
jgi:hypothetical protein